MPAALPAGVGRQVEAQGGPTVRLKQVGQLLNLFPPLDSPDSARMDGCDQLPHDHHFYSHHSPFADMKLVVISPANNMQCLQDADDKTGSKPNPE
jgi:hypothetical protein